jgi:hypothetical protein
VWDYSHIGSTPISGTIKFLLKKRLFNWRFFNKKWPGSSAALSMPEF